MGFCHWPLRMRFGLYSLPGCADDPQISDDSSWSGGWGPAERVFGDPSAREAGAGKVKECGRKRPSMILHARPLSTHRVHSGRFSSHLILRARHWGLQTLVAIRGLRSLTYQPFRDRWDSRPALFRDDTPSLELGMAGVIPREHKDEACKTSTMHENAGNRLRMQSADSSGLASPRVV